MRYLPSKAVTSLRYTVDESPEGYTLSLWKQVPEGMVASAVEGEISNLKEQSYRPNYHLVRDLWGNSYFVEEEADEEELLRDALSKLDIKAINRKIARSLFQEYEIDLNHRGDELTVSSRKDGISKAFEIGCQIDDVKITGCRLNEKQDYGVLQISLIKSRECRGQTNDLARLIQWSQLQPTPEDEAQKDEESLKAAEAKQADIDAKREAEMRARIEAQIAAKLEAERQVHEAEERKKIELQRIQEEEKKRVELQRAQEEERKQKEAVLKRRIANEEKDQESRRLKQQQLEEKKAKLIEKQRAKRIRAEKVKAASPPKTVTININFGNDDSPMHDSDEVAVHSLKRHQSPVLEDVDDAEICRFNESLSKSPKEPPIVEEI